VLGLAVPQTGAALSEWRAGDIGDFAARGAHGTPQAARTAIPLLEAADDRFGDPWARVRAGTLRLFLAYTIPQPAGAAAELRRAVNELAQALGRAPAADPVSWTALAQGWTALGDQAAARRALDMSLRLAGYEPRLALWRSEIGLALMSELDNGERLEWARQARIAWDYSRPAVLGLARQSPAAMALLTEALAADPKMLIEFEKALAE
jgi:hypothetical protein